MWPVAYSQNSYRSRPTPNGLSLRFHGSSSTRPDRKADGFVHELCSVAWRASQPCNGWARLRKEDFNAASKTRTIHEMALPLH